MDMLFLIVSISMIIWYIIDRFKELWTNLPYGKFITIGISAILSFACVFCFQLDILVGFGLFVNTSIMGEILTALVFMGGSSAVSELIGLIKNTTDIVKVKTDSTPITYLVNQNLEQNSSIQTTKEENTEQAYENDESNVIIEESNTLG